MCVCVRVYDVFVCVYLFSYMGGTNFWGGTKQDDVSFVSNRCCLFSIDLQTNKHRLLKNVISIVIRLWCFVADLVLKFGHF